MKKVDPWKDAVLHLPRWDGVARLHTVFEDVFEAEPSPVLAEVACAFFAAIVMRQLRPGAPAPVMPVLIGPQGIGKSRFVVDISRSLGVPLPASIAFSDDRRMSMAASRSVIAEMAEMSGLSKRDADEIKRWTTDDNDVYRKPYEKQEEAHPRRFVPIGTANKHETNRDETGNRRFGPVFCRSAIDPNWTVELPQILAEAKSRYCENENDYYALIRRATDAVKAYNEAAMHRGDGIPVSDLDDLLPGILRAQVAQSDKRRVQSSVMRAQLDIHASGRRFSAQDISRWLLARGWLAGKDGLGMRYYVAPDSFVDISEKVVTIPFSNVDNPFTKGVM